MVLSPYASLVSSGAVLASSSFPSQSMLQFSLQWQLVTVHAAGNDEILLEQLQGMSEEPLKSLTELGALVSEPVANALWRDDDLCKKVLAIVQAACPEDDDDIFYNMLVRGRQEAVLPVPDGYTFQANPTQAFAANFPDPLGVAVDRESKVQVQYRRTFFHEASKLVPSFLQCEISALTLATFMLEQGMTHVRIVEFRPKPSQLYHAHSVWRPNDEVVRYDGIHYAAEFDGNITDLQSVLPIHLPLESYLEQSFPGQKVNVTYYYPNEFRTRMRGDRVYRAERSSNYRRYPELLEDTRFPDPRRKTISVNEILRRVRDGRSG